MSESKYLYNLQSFEKPFIVTDKLANLIAKFYDSGSLIFFLQACKPGTRFLKIEGENGSYQLWKNPDVSGLFDLEKDFKPKKIEPSENLKKRLQGRF